MKRLNSWQYKILTLYKALCVYNHGSFERTEKEIQRIENIVNL